MVRMLFLVLALLATAMPSDAADDPAASRLVKLFIDACIPNMGHHEGVRAYAESNHLAAITNPAALTVFTGSSDKGAAWAIPAAEGNFALSIWSQTKACAVWAQNADPALVETDFRKIVEGSKKPGLELTVLQDMTTTGPHGKARALVYKVQATGAARGFEFIMLTAERPGGAFQASLQVAGFLAP